MSVRHTGQVVPEITNEEHISKGGVHAKKVAVYVYDADTDTLLPGIGDVAVTSSPAKDSDRFGIQAISDDGTYKYFFFEADDADYYILRKNKTTKVFSYAAGTGGYASVYQSAILGPSGTPTWGDKGTIF
jgi:hypothetical protein